MRANLKQLINSHLRVLIEEIGERPGASPNDHRAAEYISEILAKSGWEVGDDEYLRRRGQKLDDVIVAINIDSVGQRLAANSIATFSASDAFEASLRQLTPAYPGVVWVEPWPQSNHSTFSMRGVPSIAFSSTGRIELAHWPDDDLRWIDAAKIGDVVQFIQEMLSQLAGHSASWTRG